MESFIDKLRDECLNRELLRNGREAQVTVEAWRQEYNDDRPHSSSGYLTPAESARQYYEKNRGQEPLETPEEVTFTPKGATRDLTSSPFRQPVVPFVIQEHTAQGGSETDCCIGSPGDRCHHSIASVNSPPDIA